MEWDIEKCALKCCHRLSLRLSEMFNIVTMMFCHVLLSEEYRARCPIRNPLIEVYFCVDENSNNLDSSSVELAAKNIA